MEYQDYERIVVLEVENLCCDAYQTKLRKKLFEHEGVSSIEIQVEKSVVLVIGKVDPNSLVNIVARTGKHAEIVCSSSKHVHCKCCNISQQSCKQHYCCQNDNKSHKIQEEEQQHKCEDYVPPPVDERIRRDYWRRTHSWRQPAGQFSGYFGQFPSHSGVPFRHDPLWFVAEPPRPPPPGRRRFWPGSYEYDYFH